MGWRENYDLDDGSLGGLACPKVSKQDNEMGRQTGLTVFYNGECPICGKEIAMYKRVCAKHDIEIIWRDITQDESVTEELGKNRDELARRLYAKDADGKLYAGVDAFEQVWAVLPGFGWLAWTVRQPVLSLAAWIGYEKVMAPILFAMHKRRQKGKTGDGD